MYNIKIQYLCCDKADENDDFERAFKEKGTEMEIKYTTTDTPHQNGCIEQKFATLFNWLNVMLGGKILSFLRNCLQAIANHVALDSWVHKFDEMWITTYLDIFHLAELANKGIQGIWVGFNEGHAVPTMCTTPRLKNISTMDMNFLQM